MPHRTYRFGEFRLDAGAHELRRGEALVTLPPHAFDGIVYLIEHRDRAVGRDELVAAIWGRTEVTDAQIYHLIRNARHALGERGDAQGSIRTIPRVGFRWVRDVSVDAGAAAAGESPAVRTAQPLAQRPWRNRKAATAALLGVALLLAAGVFAWPRREQAPPFAAGGTSPLPHAPSETIAVLPVETRGAADAQNAWLRLGLMDFIAARLRRASVSVLPSDNVVALLPDERAPEAAAADVRAATGACCIVSPSVLESGGGWVVRLALRKDGQAPRLVEAQAKDVIQAASAAVDRLLDSIGRPADRNPAAAAALQDAEWYQRAEAAVLRDDFAAARRLLTAAPDALRAAPETRLRLAWIELHAGELQRARQMFADLLKDIRKESEPLLHARALTGAAGAALRLGDASAATVAYASDAIAELQTLDEPRHLADAYTWRAIAYANQNRYDLASADFSKARIAFEVAGDTLGVARSEGNQGALAVDLGRAAEALPLLNRAAQTFQRFGDLEEQSMMAINQITAHLDLVQPGEALAVASNAGSAFDGLHNPHWRRAFKAQRARALMANGRLTEARSLLDELARNADPGDVVVTGTVKSALARLDLDAGRAETAVILAQQAVDLLAEARADRPSAWLLAVRALRQLDRRADASDALKRFAAWAASIDAAPALPLAHLADAEQSWFLGRRDEATAKLDGLLSAVTRDASPAVLVEVVASSVNVLIDQGDLDRASAAAGRIAAFADHDFASALVQLRLYHALRQREAWHAALDQARALAGERTIPPALTTLP